MSDQHPSPAIPPEEFIRRFDNLAQRLDQVKDAAARHFLPGEIERFAFDGKTGGAISVVDDRGSNALSYAVYNPNDFRIFVGLAGGSATPDGLIVPKQKLVIAPLIVNGHISLAADAAQLAEGSGTILRVRFPTPQPFAAYSLS